MRPSSLGSAPLKPLSWSKNWWWLCTPVSSPISVGSVPERPRPESSTPFSTSLRRPASEGKVPKVASQGGAKNFDAAVHCPISEGIVDWIAALSVKSMPHAPLASWMTECSSPTSEGMDPSRSLLWKYSEFVACEREPISVGTVDESVLYEMFTWRADVIFPISVGMLPVMSWSAHSKWASFDCSPMCVGKNQPESTSATEFSSVGSVVTLKSFPYTTKCSHAVSFVNWPSSVGS